DHARLPAVRVPHRDLAAPRAGVEQHARLHGDAAGAVEVGLEVAGGLAARAEVAGLGHEAAALVPVLPPAHRHAGAVVADGRAATVLGELRLEAVLGAVDDHRGRAHLAVGPVLGARALHGAALHGLGHGQRAAGIVLLERARGNAVDEVALEREA